MKRLFVATALAMLVAAPARGQAGLDSLVPPSPAPDGFIVDQGPVLDHGALARLNTRIAAVQAATRGDIAVAILRDIGDRAPVDVGVAIYRAWKVGHVDSIGSERRDLGALLLIVPKELAPSKRGECWITTGRGAEALLLDADAGAICRDSIIPHLKAQDYEAAINAGVEAIALAFVETSTSPSSSAATTAIEGPSDGTSKTPWIAGALLGTGALGGGVAGAMAYRRRRPRMCPRGHGKMVRLSEAEDDAALDEGQRAEERIGSLDYDVWACTQCDARIVIAYGGWRSSYKKCGRCGYRTVQATTRTIHAATRYSEGLEQIDLDCQHCGWRDTTRRVTPRIPPPSSSSSGGGGGGGGGGSSFGGSGGTSGGGGGSSY